MNNPNPIHASAVEKDLSGSAGASPAGVPAPENWIPGPSQPFGAALDLTKPLRTKGNKKAVQIVAIVHTWIKPVIGIIECRYLGNEPMQWDLSGRFSRDGSESALDLENYEPAVLETAKPSAEAQPKPSRATIDFDDLAQQISDIIVEEGRAMRRRAEDAAGCIVDVIRAALSQSTPKGGV